MNNFQNFTFPTGFNMPQGTPQVQNMVFDPTKLNMLMKKSLIGQNIFESKAGRYKMCPKARPITCQFVNNYDPKAPSNICEVSVINEHSVDVAEKFAEKGLNANMANNMNPVVLNVVGSDFTGTNFERNEEIRDEMLNLRTSFNNTVGTNNPYPIKVKECVYAKFVTVIRPKNLMGFLAYPLTYRFALITTPCIKKPKLLKTNIMKASDYLTTCSIIECAFQTAIAGSHTVLILTPFGHEEDENPVDDIIKIYNFCIHKYGHRFKHIIFAIPPFYPNEIFEEYNKNIIRPQDIVTEIDTKYDKLEMKKNLENTSKEPAKEIEERINAPTSDQQNLAQMQNMFKMMQNNPMMMEMFRQMNQQMPQTQVNAHK